MSDEPRQEEPSGSLPRELTSGTVLAGRYRVERLLGEGGMGAVYLAEHVLMKKAVALKVLHREMTAHPEVVARFEREAVAAARIDHPNVAAAMDFGRLEDGSFYLVLEFVGGNSLRQLLDEGALPVERALGIARQIAHALVAAHAAGIVHRDLKPDNVMLIAQPDGKDLVKVLDFGIAKVSNTDEPAKETGRALTRFGTVMGTAGYMAPEQALGTAVDARADLYSFGVVLYEALAGERPFDAEEVAQILAKQLTESPPELPEHVPSELSALLGKLLATRPEERIQSAAELVSELERLGVAPAVRTELVTARTEVMPALESLPSTTRSGIVGEVPAESGRGLSRPKLVAIGLGAAVILALAAALSERRTNDLTPGAVPSATALVAQSHDVLGNGVPSTPAETPSALLVAPSARTPRAENSAPTVTETSEIRTTKTNGRTTTTRTTRRTSVEQHTTRRQRSHGGLYIPPPSQWFK